MDNRYYDDPDNPPDDTPLLGLDELDSDGEDGHDADGTLGAGSTISSNPALNAAWYQVKTPRAVIVVIAFYLFSLVMSGMIAIIPLFRLMEDVLCRRYYDTEDPVPEEKCKEKDIQANLAWLGGIYAVVNGVVSLLVSLPWGILSDRIGRKPILWFSVASLMISGSWTVTVLNNPHKFPIELICLSPLFLVFGGGIDVNINIIHTIIADVATDRTAGFVWTGLGVVLGGAIGPAVSAFALEKYGPWPPLMWSGMILLPMMVLTFTILPETLPPKREEDGPDMLALPSTVHVPHKANESLMTSLRVTARKTVKQVRTGFSESMGILNNNSIRVLLLPFVLHAAISASSTGIFAQSISVRFGWTLAQAAYLFSVKGVLTLVCLVSLPFASKALSPPAQEPSVSSAPEISTAPPVRRTRRYLLPASPFGRDFTLLQFSICAVLVGSVLMGTPALWSMITGMVFSTMGVGLTSVAKALVGYYVDKDKTARLYTLTGMVETLGSLLAGPTMAWLFGAGVSAGGILVGLPFFYIAVFCGLVMLALIFVRPPKPRGIALGDGPDGQA